MTESLAARARRHSALGEPVRLAIVDALLLGDSSPGEIARALNLPTNLVAHHVQVLEDTKLVTRTPSQGDRRRTYLKLLPGALAALAAPVAPAPPRVLFVCTHNSARSQLAAALWARRSRIPAASAGTAPAKRIHPLAVQVARRHGLALHPRRTAHFTAVVRPDDLVIAVCDGAHECLERTPHRRLHWSVPDPAVLNTSVAFEIAFSTLADRVDRLVPFLNSGADHD